MLENQFYFRLFLNFVIGIMFLSALYVAAQRDNCEEQPQKHLVMKIVGWLFVSIGILNSITTVFYFTQVVHPTQMIDYIGPNSIVRPSSVNLKWGYPTLVQSLILNGVLTSFATLGIGCYLICFKKSQSTWFKKILKFFSGVLLFVLMFSASDVHYFDVMEFVVPALFYITWGYGFKMVDRIQTIISNR